MPASKIRDIPEDRSPQLIALDQPPTHRILYGGILITPRDQVLQKPHTIDVHIVGPLRTPADVDAVRSELHEFDSRLRGLAEFWICGWSKFE